ncbi:energy-coupled thiamine transporter ThiT [Metabacillus sp. HB246100]
MQSNRRLLFLVEVAILSALALLLDFSSSFILKLPQGGSVSIGMIPIFIMSYRWGLKGGLSTGFLLGLLQAILTPQIFHPVQGFIDYYLAFTVVGFSGLLFKPVKNSLLANKKNRAMIYISLGMILGGLLRLVMHVISGVFFFASFAPEGTPVLLYSISYNASYMLPTIIISAIIVNILLIASPRLINKK